MPGRFDLELDGVGYMLHEEGDQPALAHQSLRQQREQSGGAAANIGEQTINPEGFWRRSRDSWAHGAGQTYGDRDTSDPERFRTSVGVDVFSTRHQLTLLHAVDQAHSAASGDNLAYLAYANGRVYRAIYSSGGLLYSSSPLTTPWTTTAVTGGPVTCRGLAVLNNVLYIAGDGGDLYSSATSGSTAAAFTTGATLSGVATAKGRLFAWQANLIYNITAAGALPAALATLPGGSVMGVAGEKNWVYIAVSDTARAVIYKTTIKPDGTALDTPSAAGELPIYETISASTTHPIFAYAGFLFVATTHGIRMASIDGNGDLTFGSFIPATNVTSFTAHGRFVFACTSTGMVRLDLSTSIGANVPAYANDLAPTALSFGPADAVVVNGQVVFVHSYSSNVLVQVESATKYVASGYVDSGLLALDLADKKTPVALDVEATYPSTTGVTEAISVDRGATFTTVDTWDAGDQDEQAISGVAAARAFELRTTLTSPSPYTSTPTLYRHTLKAEPNVNQSDYIIARLRLYESVIDNTGSTTNQNPSALRSALRDLQQARTVATLIEGDSTYTVTVRDMDWEAHSRCATDDGGDWNGVATIRCKVVTG